MVSWLCNLYNGNPYTWTDSLSIEMAPGILLLPVNAAEPAEVTELVRDYKGRVPRDQSSTVINSLDALLVNIKSIGYCGDVSPMY